MRCHVYKKDDNMHISFDDASVVFNEMEYPIGNCISDFTSFPDNLCEEIFEVFKAMFLNLYYSNDSYNNILSELNAYISMFNIRNSYLNFYIETFVSYLMAHYDFSQRDLAFQIADSFLLKGAKYIRLYETEDPKLSVEDGTNEFIVDLLNRQEHLREDFNAITSSADELKEFSQLQRLYLLTMKGRNYLTGKFQTSLMPNHFPLPSTMKKLKTALLEKDIDIVEMVTIETIDDLIGYELYHTIKLDLPIRKCKNCDEFFIVRGRIDTEYCYRILQNETKPCNIIGATRNYWDGKKGNLVHNEFQKAYKRNHSRRRVGTMSESDFFTWSEEARAKCKECEAGEMTLQKYKLWLGNKQ